jgi:hypothetical protein
VFYPWLRETLDEDDVDMVEEAVSVDEVFDAKVKVLGEYVKHHVREEEGEIFPSVASEREALDGLGRQMQARKEELDEELGIDHEGKPVGGRRPGNGAASARK